MDQDGDSHAIGKVGHCCTHVDNANEALRLARLFVSECIRGQVGSGGADDRAEEGNVVAQPEGGRTEGA